MAVRSCVQTALKAANSVVGLAGMAVIVHALWMLRAWSRQAADLQRHLPVPWFMYALLGLGIVMCLLACSGQVAAETANGPCLYCHVIFVFFLVILEVAIAADVFLNSNWEEDFPDDPSGKFDEFKHFLRSNFEIWEWVGLSVVAAQALSTILAVVLRALGPDPEIDYDSDDDMMPATFPILRNQAQHGPNYVEPNLPRRNDSWNVRILDKAEGSWLAQCGRWMAGGSRGLSSTRSNGGDGSGTNGTPGLSQVDEPQGRRFRRSRRTTSSINKTMVR